MMNNKAQLHQLPSWTMMLVLGIVILAIGGSIVVGFQQTPQMGVSCLGGNTLNTTNGLNQCYNSSTATGTDLSVVKPLGYNTTSLGGQGLGNISAQFPLIGTVLGFAVILSLVMGTLYFRSKQQD
jgi:hypothetical protein